MSIALSSLVDLDSSGNGYRKPSSSTTDGGLLSSSGNQRSDDNDDDDENDPLRKYQSKTLIEESLDFEDVESVMWRKVNCTNAISY